MNQIVSGNNPSTWTSEEWFCNCFPVQTPGQRSADIATLLTMLNIHLSSISDEDTSNRNRVLHVAHILVTMQGPDGLWPVRFDLKTGEALTSDRTAAPTALFSRLQEMLNSSEFNVSLKKAGAGISAR